MYRFIKFKEDVKLENIMFTYKNGEEVTYTFFNKKAGYVFQIPEYHDVIKYSVVENDKFYLDVCAPSYGNFGNILDINGALNFEHSEVCNRENIISCLISVIMNNVIPSFENINNEFSYYITENFIYEYQNFLAYKGISIQDLEIVFNKYGKSKKFIPTTTKLTPFALKNVHEDQRYIELCITAPYNASHMLEVYNQFNELILSKNLFNKQEIIHIDVTDCKGYIKFSTSLKEIEYSINFINEMNLESNQIDYSFSNYNSKQTIIFFKNHLNNSYIKSKNIREFFSKINQVYVKNDIYEIKNTSISIEKFIKQFAKDNSLNIEDIYLYGENDAANFIIKDKKLEHIKKIAVYPIPNIVYARNHNKKYILDKKYNSVCYDLNIFSGNIIDNEVLLVPYVKGNKYLTNRVEYVEVPIIPTMTEYLNINNQETLVKKNEIIFKKILKKYKRRYQ